MNNVRKAGAALAVTVVSLLAMGASAFAVSPLDGVTTQVTDSETVFTDFVIGTGVPVLFGLLILGVGIRLGVKYLRRAARSA